MYKYVKQGLDRAVSLAALILLSPFFLLIAAAIKATSPGPVFFRQDRVGLQGKPFSMYKFRSMVVGAQQMGAGLFNYEGDPRVTRVGRFLRNTSLDELPQLLNIVKGEMAIIGPRPSVVGGSLGDYATWNEQYKKRVEVLPGVTGLAQVNGRNTLSWEEKLKFDNEYVDLLPKKGWRLDMQILIKTVGVVLSRDSIYEVKPEGQAAEEAAKQATEKAWQDAHKGAEEKEEANYVR